VVMGMHCFHRACQVQVGGQRNAARVLAVEQMCETATAHLLRAMDRSTRGRGHWHAAYQCAAARAWLVDRTVSGASSAQAQCPC
jgi:hypothetical protein